MAHRFTPEQAQQNRAFLRALRRTGNVTQACRDLGVSSNTYIRRRPKCPAFAADWDAALAFAQARIADRADWRAAGGRATPDEPNVVRLSNGRLQLRRQQAGHLTRAGEQAFLSALSATANVSLSAAAAGFSKVSIYNRRRTSPAFAREMRMALQMGYDRLELALLASFDPGSYADDAWRRNDPPPIPSMSATQALHLMNLHQKEARLEAEPAHIRRRRGESREAHSYRLSAMYEARMERAREAFNVAEAERRAQGKPWLFGPKDIAPLPDLSQVTGWSKAKPHGASDADRGAARAGPGSVKPTTDDAGCTPGVAGARGNAALFGGWRLGNLKP